MTDMRSDRWGNQLPSPGLGDLDPPVDGTIDLGGPIDADIEIDVDDVDLDDVDLDDVDLDLSDMDEAADDDAATRLLRIVRVVAVVGAAGWLIALAANLLSPSNLLDTTGRDDEEELVVGDDQSQVGGSPFGTSEPSRPAGTLEIEGLISGGDLESGLGDAASASTSAAADQSGSTDASSDQAASATAAAATAAAAAPGAAATNSLAAAPTAGAGARAGGAVAATANYQSNLAMLKAATVRNRNHDGSAYRGTAQADLAIQNLYGPRSDYLGNPGGNPEQSFPVPAGGQFRTSCEFSHFGYDDPLVFPGQPGASHLHMFFGNTDVNAYSTHQTLIDSGSSTCNGQELNRTGYWVPAMFDGQGNVRVPERIVVYYKGEGRSRGNAEVYPSGAAMIASVNLDAAPTGEGGTGGKKLSFHCSDNFSTNTGNGSQTMASCDGSQFAQPGRWTVLEMNVKFPQCWNGQSPGDWNNFRPPNGDWYGSNCNGEFSRNLPNLEYFVNYRVDPGENTSNWYLSSDVDPTSFGLSKGRAGASTHGDWWGGWHPEVNKMWIDNCVNRATGSPTGCGMGYLTDGGPNGSAPVAGPALKFRPQYEGPYKVPAADLFAQLCPAGGRQYQRPEDAAYCRPG